MKRVAVSILFLIAVAACAGPAGVSPGGGLMYQVPDPATVVYVIGDTITIGIDAGAMGSMEIKDTRSATWAMTFARGAGGLLVTASVQELLAEQTNPMGPSVSATENDIEGDVVFTMDPTGKTSVVSLPDLKGQAESLANPIQMVKEFFPRLPGEAVDVGATWTDTLSYEVEMSNGMMTSSKVMTFTVQGDTVVNGAALVHITFQGKNERVVEAAQDGMQTTQTVSGDLDGTLLWDPARSLMVRFEEDFEMDGMYEIVGAPIPPMPLDVRGRSRIMLQGG